MLRSQADDAGRAWVLEAAAQQQDEASFLAARCGEMQTAQPFADLEDLRSIDVPVLLIPGDDPGHDPLITETYAQHLRQLTRATTCSSMDPLTWVDDLRSLAIAS
jgi:hypothetical protein